MNGYDTRHLSTDYLLIWIGQNTQQKLVTQKYTPINIMTQKSDTQSYKGKRSEPTSHDFKHQISNQKERR